MDAEQVWTLIIVLTFALSSFFFLSWGPAILSAKFKHKSDVSILQIVDFCIGVFLVWLWSGLTLWWLTDHDLPPTENVTETARRGLIFALALGIAVIRAGRWAYRIWKHDQHDIEQLAVPPRRRDLETDLDRDRT